ncbi:MAG: Glycine cleavage system H protein [Chlamydiae bacterium]|nr:Glycine cleavage system H protein [Chlamydiota bacterium]
MKKYTDSHEWIDLVGENGRVGISTYALKELGEVVYIQLPKVGETVQAYSEVAVLESTKAAADIYSPITGKIIEVNEELSSDPLLLNQDPEGKGWLFTIAIADRSEYDSLLDQPQYLQLIL